VQRSNEGDQWCGDVILGQVDPRNRYLAGQQANCSFGKVLIIGCDERDHATLGRSLGKPHMAAMRKVPVVGDLDMSDRRLGEF